MREEISAAVHFLARLIEKGEKFNQQQLEHFKIHLFRLLIERCKNHWYTDKPDKGQGYRCIRVNGLFHDPILKKAADYSGMKYEDIKLPYELTVWVDPNEVCCRFGENKGSFCTLASFKSKTLEETKQKEVSMMHQSQSPSPPLHVMVSHQEDGRGRMVWYDGDQRGTWFSPPRHHAAINHYHQHWPPKSTVKV